LELVKLGLISLDRLVRLVEERGGALPIGEAAQALFSLDQARGDAASQLLRPLLQGDARFALVDGHLFLAARIDPPLEEATFVVLDLETTGLPTPGSRIYEIGAVRIRKLTLDDRFELLVDPEAARAVFEGSAAVGPAPAVDEALQRLWAFAGDAVLVAHNARFDVGFIDLELARTTGQRLAAPVIDTLPLARNLLRGRIERTNLAALAFFFGVSVEPCHRALPDARATAEVFLGLVAAARERGAGTLSELEALAAPAAARRDPRR
jgi:DNA polymerase III epsilon subunit family exonuclease